MRKITLLLLVIATASLTGAVAKGKKCEAQKAKYVVLIGTDGTSSDVVRAHPGAFPNIEALMKNGSYTLERRSVLPSSSAVNWASMLMGAGPELHGYTTWGGQVPDLPSLSRYLRSDPRRAARRRNGVRLQLADHRLPV